MVKHWMNEHPEMDRRPSFSFRIMARFRDCLSRQVAEAINILYSKDQLLNSKNEYMANCLTRICVEENTFERKKREREEEEKDDREKERLRAFKMKNMRPKRARTTATVKEPEEPMRKRMKTFLMAGNPPDQDLDLSRWLEVAEKRCIRAGELRSRLERERLDVLERMSKKRKADQMDDGVNTLTGSVSVADSQSNTVIPEGWKLGGGDSVNTLTGSVSVAASQSNTVTSEGWKVDEEISTPQTLAEEEVIEKVNDVGGHEISKDIPKESCNLKSYKKSIIATKKTNKQKIK